MRKVIVGSLAGLGLLLAGGCNPPKSATPDKVLGASQATLNTFPSLMTKASAKRASKPSMKGTGGSGAAGQPAAGPTVPLRETAVDASQVNYANQGSVVGGAANAADAYSTGESQGVGGGGIAPQRGTGSSAQSGTMRTSRSKSQSKSRAKPHRPAR